MGLIKEHIRDFFGLIYPDLCLACQKSPAMKGEITCTRCHYELKIIDDYLDDENPILKSFWGRLPLEAAAAMFTFTKKGRIQRLIHQLKYQNKSRIGTHLGRYFGEKLIESPYYKDVDVIIPVPLHPKKLRKRGYNQSEFFARGLADAMKKECRPTALKRVVHNSSLTKKSRDERFETIENSYVLGDVKNLEGKHLLLVDDVLTTGATMEICGSKLLEIEGARLSLVVIAVGEI